MKDIPFIEGDSIDPGNMVTNIMTAVAYLNREVEQDDGSSFVITMPMMEIHLGTGDGETTHFLIDPVLAFPLLETILHLAQAIVGEPPTTGTYGVPDSPDDIDWNER